MITRSATFVLPRPIRSRLATRIAVATVTALAVTIAAGTSLASASTPAGTLRVAPAGAAFADPGYLTPGESPIIAQLTYAGLTELSPTTSKARPAIASSWSASTNRRVWTFTIRRTARWSNGTKITAPQVAKSLNRALGNGASKDYLQYITGIATVKAPSARTLVIRTGVGMPHLASILAEPYFGIVPPGAPAKPRASWPTATSLTSGAFRITRRTSSRFELAKSKRYVLRSGVKVKRILVYRNASTTSERSLYLAGKTDVNLHPLTADTHAAVPGSALIGVSFNRAGILATPSVRRGIALTIDRQNIYPDATPATGSVRTGVLDGANVAGIDVLSAGGAPDTVTAQALFVGAAVPVSSPISLIYNVSDTLAAGVAARIKTNLDASGYFTVTLVPQSAAQAAQSAANLNTGTPTMVLQGWSPDTPTLATYFDFTAQQGSFGNFTPATDVPSSQLTAAMFAANDASRAAAQRTLETSLFGASGSFPFAPLYVFNPRYTQRSWVRGVPITRFEYSRLHQLSVAAH